MCIINKILWGKDYKCSFTVKTKAAAGLLSP